MAAALAATLPAASSVPAPATVLAEALPASMSQLIDLEADIPLTCVQLDGMVVSKIMKHAQQISAHAAHGLLLGLDFDGTLEVSNSFPLPHHLSEDDEKSSKSVARYQASMLRSLREVQADDNVVGFYQAMTLGAFFTQSLVEAQAVYQERLRHGGVVVVHDISQASRGNASFHAYRLTANFLEAHKKSAFNTVGLIDHHLTFSSVLEEIPLKVRINPLLSSFLDILSTPAPSQSILDEIPSAASSPLLSSFKALDLGQGNLSNNLSHLVDAVDAYRTEEGNLAYMSRQIARERAKVEAYVAKRKEENATRAAQGLPPLPEEDVNRLFRVPVEPSRLDSLLMLGQLDAYGKSLAGMTSTGLVKMYAARGP
ncbi:hypothetical protein FISHEDRAFT_38783 [Fistulina hepatica ATCC 64428]|uniref:Eukaryotic translation initiation factor 3 subunit H n=1 Tax=Fistulina hepatica ATCC 64428 TaxID=1128425 RepID=A0A0D7AID6_9AGAR|nr:hypothetical protein FISHEDRAFT_38783 [Fistulina hepatica ATCC 64428]